jgi:CxxC motif-containing protein (DUF1111 family)
MVSRFLIAAVLAAAAPASAAGVYERPANHAAISLQGAAGWALFKRPWISAPSSLQADDGVGPLYSARSCNACHAGGGPGPVAEGPVGDGSVVRLGRAEGGGDPIYGTQIQSLALPGYDPEADVALRWENSGGLRTPRLIFANLRYGPLGAETRTAYLRAPSLFGIGMLESVPESEILSRSSTGRPNWVEDGKGKRRLGRFGWKASTAELAPQVALAFQRDFGISTSDLPGAYGECTEAESGCRNVAGRAVELPDAFRDEIATFLRLLRPPEEPRTADPGYALFRNAGCMECHALLRDAHGGIVPAYTDLLLHDMGRGLDDGIAEGSARGSEWRTAPLWDVAGSLAQGGLLHDGRATSIAEAVQWHGGQASQARASFNALSPSERKLIDDFLLRR